MPAARARRLGCVYLTLQGTLAALWWLLLAVLPGGRHWFLTPGASEATLWAYLVPDVIGYIGGSFLAAYGLARRRPWGWPILCAHAGAAGYAALYGVTLPLLSGGGWGSLLMLPSLLVPPYLVWRLRPGNGEVTGDV